MVNPEKAYDGSKEKRSFTVRSGNEKEQALSVSELTNRISSMLEKGIGDTWVKGEISNLNFPRSGHVYFDLKDQEAILPVVLFHRSAKQVDFDLKEGLEIRLYGKVSAYEERGNYQIIARELQPLGEGALKLALKQLREKLEKEGLFDHKHKQPLPELPRSIGLVTSGTGAAVQDMIRTISSRFPPVHILVVPVKVQGEAAKHEIAEAIKFLNKHSLVDVIITGRGGGSLEDLWAFNEEKVARSIFSSDIPVVSAVGHEVDTTISDLVADHTVPTPTAAGQGVVPDYDRLLLKVSNRVERLHRQVKKIVATNLKRLHDKSRRVSKAHPRNKLQRNKNALSRKMKSIHREIKHQFNNRRRRVSAAADQLDSLSPLNVLKRGYSITRQAHTQQIVREASTLSTGDQVETRLSDGSFEAEVVDVNHEE